MNFLFTTMLVCTQCFICEEMKNEIIEERDFMIEMQKDPDRWFDSQGEYEWMRGRCSAFIDILKNIDNHTNKDYPY